MTGRVSLRHVVAIVLLTTAGCSRQASQGSGNGRTVIDRQFHIAFDLPPILQPTPLSSLNLHAKSTADAHPIAAARQGGEPFGIILIAQKMQESPNGIRSAKDFLYRVLLSRSTADTPGTRGHAVNPSGLEFDWLDWRAPNGEYDSAVVTRRGDYLLAARCNAKTTDDLEAMKKALMAMKVIP